MNTHRGFTLIELMIIVAILAIIAAIAIPNLIEARRSGNESAAIGALRTISTAQTMFREGDTESRYGTLQDLEEAGLLQPKPGQELLSGVLRDHCSSYAISLTVIQDGTNWFGSAQPVDANGTTVEDGRRFFFAQGTSDDITWILPGPNSGAPKSVSEPIEANDTAAFAAAVLDEVKRFIENPLSSDDEATLSAVASSENVLAAFAAVDTNGDGKISLDEAASADVEEIAKNVIQAKADSGEGGVDEPDTGGGDEADAGSSDEADAGSDDAADTGSDDAADTGSDDAANTGSDDAADLGGDDTETDSPDVATSDADPEGGSQGASAPRKAKNGCAAVNRLSWAMLVPLGRVRRARRRKASA